MRINQGDMYWLKADATDEAGVRHPHVVLQDDVFNHSRVHTVIVCALTSNLKRASLPGNVLLEAGEGGLPRQSVVEVARVESIDKAQLGDYIGALSAARVQQMLRGLRFLQSSFMDRE